MFRVRTGPECPEDNMRELTWDRNTNCGIAREREREKNTQKENFPVKGSNLALSQNKGLSQYQMRASCCVQSSPRHQRQRDRWMTARTGRQEAISVPGRGIHHQTLSRLPVVNNVFLGSWTVDICQEGCSQKSAPQRRYTAHVRWCSSGTPEKLSGQNQGGD